MATIEKLIPDTSVIINGNVSKKIEKKEIKVGKIIIHEAALAELEHQANIGRAIGSIGLDEVKKLKSIMGNDLEFHGNRPSPAEIKYASLGEIDSMIRQLAYELDGTLITSDKVQYSVAEAKGMKCQFIKQDLKAKKLKLESFFDAQTMSVHLRENVPPSAKRGKPGAWDFLELRKELLTQEEIQEVSREIIEEAKVRKDAFIEIEREGSTIVQLANYRIVITKPPFADAWEITAVRPVKKLSLPDYKLSEKLQQRIAEQAEGILIAGAPGMGKSTFAQALAEFYSTQEKIVKTVEAPRDLVLPDAITQYAISHGDAQEIHDILLLSRPDYTVFDEMRNTDDFKLFADMRLAGVGMVGVVHGTNPVDSIQRFLGRVEMGVIPQIIDTVVFIKDGQINKVLSLQMTVKVPSGMTEADLARPVVVINDFETDKLEYEIYTYGEATVVVPVKGQAKSSGMQRLASESLQKELAKIDKNIIAEVISEHKAVIYVPDKIVPRIIGKGGENISALEDKLGIGLDVRDLSEYNSNNRSDSGGKEIAFDTKVTKKAVIFYLDSNMKDKTVDIYLGGDYLMQAQVGAKSTINISRKNKLGKLLVDELNSDGDVKLVV